LCGEIDLTFTPLRTPAPQAGASAIPPLPHIGGKPALSLVGKIGKIIEGVHIGSLSEINAVRNAVQKAKVKNLRFSLINYANETPHASTLKEYTVSC